MIQLSAGKCPCSIVRGPRVHLPHPESEWLMCDSEGWVATSDVRLRKMGAVVQGIQVGSGNPSKAFSGVCNSFLQLCLFFLVLSQTGSGNQFFALSGVATIVYLICVSFFLVFFLLTLVESCLLFQECCLSSWGLSLTFSCVFSYFSWIFFSSLLYCFIHN